MKPNRTITFLCGKMGAGKTTFATLFKEKKNTIILSEDEILSSFYPNEIKTFDDYIAYSLRIKPYVKKLITQLLETGNNVVMDFPGNTKKQRSWFKQIINETNASHELIYLDVSDNICLSQIEKRHREDPTRNRFDTEQVFYQVTAYFEEPTEEEGFNIHHIIKE